MSWAQVTQCIKRISCLKSKVNFLLLCWNYWLFHWRNSVSETTPWFPQVHWIPWLILCIRHSQRRKCFCRLFSMSMMCLWETLLKWAPLFTLNAVSQPCENAVTMKWHLLEMELVAFLFFPKPLRTEFSLQPEWRNSASIQCVFRDFQWHLLTVQFKTVIIIDLKLSCNWTEEKRPLLIQKTRATTQHADLPNRCW